MLVFMPEIRKSRINIVNVNAPDASNEIARCRCRYQTLIVLWTKYSPSKVDVIKPNEGLVVAINVLESWEDVFVSCLTSQTTRTRIYQKAYHTYSHKSLVYTINELRVKYVRDTRKIADRRIPSDLDVDVIFDKIPQF